MTVKLSLMPQGVEHIRTAIMSAARPWVKLSLMPQGVEHLEKVSEYKDAIREIIFDAARR